MASPLPFVPGTAPQAPPDMGALVGPTPAATQAAGPGPNEVAQQVMMQVRDLKAGVDALARQFPVAAEEARAASEALVALMVKVVGSISAPEPAASPQVIG
jgi:outer membrane murein-binding lipoprotein Lpp